MGGGAGQSRTRGHGRVSVDLAYVDQGYTGERPAEEAEAHGMRLEVVKPLGGEAGLRALATPLGGGTRFRMGIAIQAFSEGLREATDRFGGVALCRLRLPLPPSGNRYSRRGSITRSRKGDSVP